tara:strand:- start:1456 stop:1755 length:300 start_codon:yes stop_codon:yes gene_type:complete
MTKEDLSSTTELLEVVLNDIKKNAVIKVRTGLIKQNWEIKQVKQQTLAPYYEDDNEAFKGVPDYIMNVYITIHPSRLQKHLIKDTYLSILQQLSKMVVF